MLAALCRELPGGGCGRRPNGTERNETMKERLCAFGGYVLAVVASVAALVAVSELSVAETSSCIVAEGGL